MANFFISTALELVPELETELKEIWPFLLNKEGRPHADELKIIEIDKGGILIECDEILGFQINYFSKLANRVLLRWDEFKVRDFPKLFQKFSKLHLETKIGSEPWALEISASTSRLNNEKRIGETILSAWKKYAKTSRERTDVEATKIFVRLFDDTCTVSLDTTGKHLHFRSQKHVGEAPLRETLAAFMVRQLIGFNAVPELKKITLLDPMAGSGTLIKEASQIYQGNFLRSFSFNRWPITPKLLNLEKLKENYKFQESSFGKFKASDINEKVFGILKTECQNIPDCMVERQDLFQIPTNNENSGRIWILSNLPYGERIKVEFSVNEAIQQMIKAYNPEKIGILISEAQYREFSKSIYNANLVLDLPLSNGGLKTRFITLEFT